MSVKFDIIGRRYIWFVISALILIPGLISILVQGFNLGIDFTGGTLLDLKFSRPVTVQEVRHSLVSQQLDSSIIQLASTTQTEQAENVFIRTRVLSEEERREALNALDQGVGSFEVLRVEKVGATIGSELTLQAVAALAIAAALMIGYLTYRFEFKFAVSGIISILHDVVIVLGVFSILRKEIDASFVAAILTIVGYSITDTVVIFDRIRENLKNHSKNESFQKLVNRSIFQTLTRSIYTVLTVVFATASLYLFGGETTKNFALALLIGFVTGAYSSIFNASPIWVTWKEFSDRKRIAMRKG